MTTETIEQVALRVAKECYVAIQTSNAIHLELEPINFARRLLAALGVSVPAETGRIEPVAYLTRDKIERNPLHQFVGPETVDWKLPLYLSPPLPTKEGWQWVPVEPTTDMLKAALCVELDAFGVNSYKAMLSAAPKP